MEFAVECGGGRDIGYPVTTAVSTRETNCAKAIATCDDNVCSMIPFAIAICWVGRTEVEVTNRPEASRG